MRLIYGMQMTINKNISLNFNELRMKYYIWIIFVNFLILEVSLKLNILT